jgi:predicted RNase H-like HicB family nuclease
LFLTQKRLVYWRKQGYLEAGELEMKVTMLYPIYVWKDERSAYGAAFPDLPDVFTAADDLDDLPAMAQEAVALMFEGSEKPLPPPTAIECWQDSERYQGGFWLQIEVALPAG